VCVCVCVCACVVCDTAVFVTVTMAVSTASVVESIIVMRLCSIRSTRMPSAVRVVAFGVLGRALCVARPPTTTPAKHRRGDVTQEMDGKPQAGDDDVDVQESLLGRDDAAMTSVGGKSRSELIQKMDDLLAELKQVMF